MGKIVIIGIGLVLAAIGGETNLDGHQWRYKHLCQKR